MVCFLLLNQNEMEHFSEQYTSILKPVFHRNYLLQLRRIVIRRTPQIQTETE